MTTSLATALHHFRENGENGSIRIGFDNRYVGSRSDRSDANTRAPYSRYFNISATLSCPDATAISRAVSRFLFLTVRSAPALMSIWTISDHPACAATMSAVYP